MKNSGFSLVELIVVIAIMAILVGVAVPVYSQYIDKAQKAKDEQYLGEVVHAVEIFAAENGLELVSVAVAPAVTGTQGIELFVKDSNNATVRYTGDLEKLYEIVGDYTFSTVESGTEVEYYFPVTETPGTEAHTHDYTHERVEPTCINEGKEICSCGATRPIPAIDHDFERLVIGNMTVNTCRTCGYQFVEFDGHQI